MLQRFAPYLCGPLLVMWLGSLWIVGYLVIPQLFHTLPDRVLAASLAGELLNRVAWLGLLLAPAVIYFLLMPNSSGRRMFPGWCVWLVLLVVFGHLAALTVVQPEMAALKATVAPLDVMQSPVRDQFIRWHGVASGIYLVQSLLALVLAGYWGACRQR